MESQIALESEPSQQQPADLTQQWQDFESRRARWEEDRQRAEADFEVRRQALERQIAELESQAIQLEQRRAVLSERETALTGFAPSGGEAQLMPVDSHPAVQQVAEVLTTESMESTSDSPRDEAVGDRAAIAQLQSSGLLETEPESSPADEVENVGPPPHLLSEQSAETEKAATIADHEESIDDYMARLLNRIRGGSGPAEAHSHTKAEQRPVMARQPNVASPSTEIVEPTAIAEPPLSVDAEGAMQLVARTAPPELTVDLRAMRELANMTARGAIDKHAQGRWSKAALVKAILGVSSLICGLWLLLGATPLGTFGRVAGLVALGAGGFWSYQGISLFRNIREVGRRTTKFVEAESHPATHEALPNAERNEQVEVAAVTSDS
jgi:hypothetical protein